VQACNQIKKSSVKYTPTSGSCNHDQFFRAKETPGGVMTLPQDDFACSIPRYYTASHSECIRLRERTDSPDGVTIAADVHPHIHRPCSVAGRVTCVNVRDVISTLMAAAKNDLPRWT